MGMGLFYVSVFVFICGWSGGIYFCDFMEFLRGVLGNEGVWRWCFAGVSVVECVASVEAKQRTFGRLKMRHDFDLYF
jgi:hypothetical protein